MGSSASSAPGQHPSHAAPDHPNRAAAVSFICLRHCRGAFDELARCVDRIASEPQTDCHSFEQHQLHQCLANTRKSPELHTIQLMNNARVECREEYRRFHDCCASDSAVHELAYLGRELPEGCREQWVEAQECAARRIVEHAQTEKTKVVDANGGKMFRPPPMYQNTTGVRPLEERETEPSP